MIVLGALSQAQAEAAFRDCLALGLRPSACELQAGMVDGRVCDGSIVIDASGRRCVTHAQRAQKEAAAAASPLPPRSSSSAWVLPLGVLAASVVALLVLRR